jgi:AcrR family transcriptional regulator
MTDKQQRIIQAALVLFAEQGYNATSTSKIAKAADVSEGLIFRHFGNKKGLLQAILEETDRSMQKTILPILEEADALEVIHKAIEMPFTIKTEDYNFWKLQYQLRWQADYFHPENNNPLIEKLTWAFDTLGYEQPLLEAKLLEKILDAVATGILREGKESQLPFEGFLLRKYSGSVNL